MRHIVQRLEARAAGERRIARDGHHVLVRPRPVARHRHAERRRERSARVPRPVAIVLALRAQQEPVQPLVLPHRVEPLAAPRENLVHVALVAHVENEFVRRRVKHPVQRDGQLHHPQVRPEVAAHGVWVFLGKHAHQFIAHLLGELGQVAFGERFDVGG